METPEKIRKKSRVIPPRLHALLAGDSPLAVVIRRGPTKCAAAIGWDRSTDVFALGQWLKANIYHFRSDISPDGRHWIYFALGWRTVVAKTPYLKAMDMFAQRDAWNGGGLFLSNDEYWLNKSPFSFSEHLRSSGMAVAETWRDEPNWQGECPLIYFRRLNRDGWREDAGGWRDGDGWREGSGGDFRKRHRVITFTREINAHWTLVKHFRSMFNPPQGRGGYHETYALRSCRSGEEHPLPGWEWADMDKGRIVWAEDGCIMAGQVDEEGLQERRVLLDANPMAFEERVAPY